MSKKKNHIPVSEPEPDPFGLEYYCPSASWGDMTGLIPANSEKEDAAESYKEIYPYMADGRR